MSEIFTYKKLLDAYLDCRRNKRKTKNALAFELEFEKNLDALAEELKAGTYRPGQAICFTVIKPVPREIFAADFRDRIVHHLLVREIIGLSERSFCYDSYACRPEKGTHKAVSRLNRHIRSATENYKRPAYFLQLDIKGFFMAIDQRILFKLAEELIKKHKRSKKWKMEVLWLARTIIFNRPQDNYRSKGDPALARLVPPHKSLRQQPQFKGLPIGNYTSQFFANLYLNELDQYIKRELKARFYIRYVDDFILMGRKKSELLSRYRLISAWLEANLNLSLNRNKTRFQALDKGVDFCGYFLRLGTIYSRQKVVQRLKKLLYEASRPEAVMPEIIDQAVVKKILAQINSYFGHYCHGHCYNLKTGIYSNLQPAVQAYFRPGKDFSFLKLNKINQ